jgi:hypothetical protein
MVVLFVATIAMYAALGGVIVYSAWAQQTQSFAVPAPTRQPVQGPVPTGSNDAAVKGFFNYNNLRHVSTLQETYIVDPYFWGTMYLVIGVVLIVFYTLTISWYTRQRRKPDLYPVEVYNAIITERGGPVDALNYSIYAILLIYMVYYTVTNLMFGQYY